MGFSYVAVAAKTINLEDSRHSLSPSDLQQYLYLIVRGNRNIRDRNQKFVLLLLHSEAAARGVLWKKVFLEISLNSQESTCARVSFQIKLQASDVHCNSIKKQSLAQVFSC